MAKRQNTFLIKRSNVPSKVPAPGDLILGEMALNTADVILYTSGTTAGSILPIGWDRVARTGDTMTGPLYAPTISADTISATTYLNLPIDPDIYLTGGTYTPSASTLTLTRNDDVDVAVTGITSALKQKTNVALSTSFTGSPKTSIVVFATPFDNSNYSILITGGDKRTFTYEAKSASGFTINANAASTINFDTYWTAIEFGEN